MKTTAFAFLATILMAYPAFAQDAGGAPPPAAAAPDAGMDAGPEAGGGAGGGAGGAKGGKMKEMVQACRSQAKSQGLKGPDMKKAVLDCVGKQNPKMAARMQCRMDGKAKGLDGDQLKSFVKDCVKGGGKS